MSWREFDLWVTGYERRIKNEWTQSSEIMAGLRNLLSAQTTKPGRNIKIVTGWDLNPYNDNKTQSATSNLQDFKALCKRMGIPWNPVKN